MSKRDYYEVLGVPKGAPVDEIKKAYRQMALKYHPDKNPGDKAAEEMFKEAAEAYSVLGNPDKRAQYDRFGHAGVSGGGFNGNFDPSMFGDFSDIFESVFGLGDLFGRGSSRGRTRAQRGNDLQYEIKISFLDSAFGTETKLRIPVMETCAECGGSGAAKGSGPVTCPTCNGGGQVRYQQGFFTIARTCSHCNGAGKIIRNPCPECHGKTRVRKEKTIEAKIPAGISTGTRLRLQGQGEAGVHGGPPGDLYILVYVEEHAFFNREGSDLLLELPVSLAQAALGTDLTVPTLYGDERLKVPAGTQPDTVITLKGRGMPEIGGGRRGDLYVRVKVDVPRKLSREQRKILEDFAAVTDKEMQSSQKQFFGRIRESVQRSRKAN